MTKSVIPREKIRVLVVDDSAFIRRAIIRMFEDSPDIRVIDIASDGEMAIDLIKKHRPDVVTLDVQMPVLDGLAALERIMRECPVPVIMLSSLTGKGGDKTLKALELGAVDFIDKASAGGPMDFTGIARELSSKILVAAGINLDKLTTHVRKPSAAISQAYSAAGDIEIVLVVISTGGPPALSAILADIPASFPCPILIVQHMPVGFTASLAERLNKGSRITVKEAEDGEALLPGVAYVAQGGRHLVVRRAGNDLKCRLETEPANTLHMPSVDVLFNSAAKVTGQKTLAFVLTGMGRDGAAGAQSIKQAGGKVVAESEETAIVFGMPKAAMDLTRVDAVIPLHQVADYMINMTATKPTGIS